MEHTPGPSNLRVALYGNLPQVLICRVFVGKPAEGLFVPLNAAFTDVDEVLAIFDELLETGHFPSS